MSPLLGELLGTMILVFLGDCVVANVILAKTKANNNSSGWTIISLGWMVAVVVPVMMFGPMSGAHFNPAVTLGLAATGGFPWASVPLYIVAQMVGAFIGAIFVYIMYKPHFDVTEDKGCKLGVFSTGPAIKNTPFNFISEFLGTFLLVFAIIGAGQTTGIAGEPAAHGAIGVGAIILAMGTALGGTTGYAINPARDLGPRIAHAVLPIKDKGDSDWGYSWIPVIGPLCGGLVAGLLSVIVW